MLTELGIYILFVLLEFMVVSAVSIGNYLAWLDDEHGRTGVPHGKIFSWFGFAREFARAQTLGFSVGLLAFSLSALIFPLSAIKEAFLSIGVGCLSAHFHRCITHSLRETLPSFLGQFLERRRSVPPSLDQLKMYKLTELERALILETRAEEKFRLQEIIREMRGENPAD